MSSSTDHLPTVAGPQVDASDATPQAAAAVDADGRMILALNPAAAAALTAYFHDLPLSHDLVQDRGYSDADASALWTIAAAVGKPKRAYR